MSYLYQFRDPTRYRTLDLYGIYSRNKPFTNISLIFIWTISIFKNVFLAFANVNEMKFRCEVQCIYFWIASFRKTERTTKPCRYQYFATLCFRFRFDGNILGCAKNARHSTDIHGKVHQCCRTPDHTLINYNNINSIDIDFLVSPIKCVLFVHGNQKPATHRLQIAYCAKKRFLSPETSSFRHVARFVFNTSTNLISTGLKI